MCSYAKRLDLVENLSFIAPGDEKTWNTAKFDAIANCLLEKLKKSGRLVYSGVPTYRKMTKHVSKKKKVVDEWHFGVTEKNMHTCALMYMMVAKITHYITQLRKATDPKCTQASLTAKERIPEALSITTTNQANSQSDITKDWTQQSQAAEASKQVLYKQLYELPDDFYSDDPTLIAQASQVAGFSRPVKSGDFFKAKGSYFKAQCRQWDKISPHGKFRDKI